MITVLLAGALLSASPLQQPQTFDTDTTVSVSAATRLKLENVGGEVIIKAWDKNQVRIQASHSSRTAVGISLSESSLRLSPKGSRGTMRMGGVVDYVLTVPAAMSIEIGGMYADVTIEGTRGEISVQTVEGNINVKGGGDVLQLQTVNGKINVQGARGRLDLRSVSEDVEVSDVVGDVIAETVSGSVILTRIDGKRVEAQTVSGDVRFDGTLAARRHVQSPDPQRRRDGGHSGERERDDPDRGGQRRRLGQLRAPHQRALQPPAPGVPDRERRRLDRDRDVQR